MKIAKKITAAACIALAVQIAAACGSSPKAAAVPDELDAAIREASDYLDGNVPAGNKIVILNVQSDSDALSDYIIDELIANAVNDKNFPVVDRQQLDAIRSELNFQWAGEVDDNSAQEIGKMVGAQIIVSGAISKVGDNYRMRIRVQGQFNRNIPPGATITALVNSGSKGYSSSGGAGTVTAQSVSGGSSGGGSGGTQTAQAGGNSGVASGGGSGQAAQTLAAPAYKVGDTGPAGGLIFYDKGNSRGGWRYLEAAYFFTVSRYIGGKLLFDLKFPLLQCVEFFWRKKWGFFLINVIAPYNHFTGQTFFRLTWLRSTTTSYIQDKTV
ncbi:hypothetical protein AGMMS49944_26170 [Spirochaetia bacterium]|nr:hypothetical protein AGMMS49944_26170 [Spirochaetia bacterium]